MIIDFPAFLGHVTRRYGESTIIKVEDLERTLREEHFEVDRSLVIRLAKEVDKKGWATFYNGRRNHSTRLECSKKKPKEWLSVPPAPGQAAPSPQTEFVGIPVMIRPGLIVNVQVPVDLSATEAERIADFIIRWPLQQAGQLPTA